MTWKEERACKGLIEIPAQALTWHFENMQVRVHKRTHTLRFVHVLYSKERDPIKRQLAEANDPVIIPLLYHLIAALFI